MAQQTAVEQIMSDIKKYVRSLNVPDNPIYQKNELLILSCFQKAMEICEGRLEIEKEQIMIAYTTGESDGEHYEYAALEYYNETYQKK